MDEIAIRSETPQDAVGVRAVLELAFRRPDEALLVERLRGSPAFSPAIVLLVEAVRSAGRSVCRAGTGRLL